jgi:hypothetical protein
MPVIEESSLAAADTLSLNSNSQPVKVTNAVLAKKEQPVKVVKKGP